MKINYENLVIDKFVEFGLLGHENEADPESVSKEIAKSVPIVSNRSLSLSPLSKVFLSNFLSLVAEKIKATQQKL